MEFHRQLIHQHHLQSNLQCGNDPTVANHNGIPSASHPPAPLAIPFTLRERSYSCKSQWNSVDRTCTKNTWKPIYNAEPIRAWSDHDPSMTRPHTRPSRNRRTAEADHRGSGTDFVWKKHRLSHFVRDFLQNSIGNSSTSSTCNPICNEGTILELQITMEFHRQTHPPAPLAIPFTMRERSYSCKSQWNSIGKSPTSTTCNPIYIAGTILQFANHNGILSTAHARKTLETPFTMRNRSENDPRMIRAWSDHTRDRLAPVALQRGRSSTFRDGLCMEKHRLSCICYLSKTHFVRDFLQNSIGNSSTSTTCNPIYSEVTILELQITMEFHRQTHPPAPLATPFTMRERSYTAANHNGILSTAHARKTAETPFTMRNRSEHDPTMIRAWSDHTRDRLATVAPQR